MTKDEHSGGCCCPDAIYAREISHRANNALQTALAAVHLGRRGGAPLDRAIDRLQNAVVLNRALEGGKPGIAEIETRIREVCGAVIRSAGADDVDTIIDAGPLFVDQKTVRPVLMLVAELVGNAVRHAFPDGSGTILVSLRDDGRRSTLVVEDSGVCGGWQRPGGQGHGIVNSLAACLGGRVHRSVTPGGSSRVVAHLPSIALIASPSAGQA